MAYMYDVRDPHPKGLPRPLAEYNGRLLPVPWSQDGDRLGTVWGNVSTFHQIDAMEYSLCLLCGIHVEKGFVIFHLPSGRIPELPISPASLDKQGIIDSAPLHERCAKLTMAHCPHLAQKRADFALLPYDAKCEQLTLDSEAQTA